MDDAAPDTRHLEILSAMTECGFALGKVASDIAQQAAADDLKRFLAATAEFRHCFFAVRMGIRLSQAIRTGALAERPERERLEAERPETAASPERDETAEWPERPERLERLETEGDYERVSLSRFLKTLTRVADRAEARGDQLPPHIRDTTLPTLRGLLREANAPPGGAESAVAILSRPPAVPASRSRLLASTVSPRLTGLPLTARRGPDSS